MATNPVCEFVEGQIRAGADGRGCRLYGHDPDIPSSRDMGLVLEIEGEHDGDWFTAKRDTLVRAEDPPSAALDNTSDDTAENPLGHVWLLEFNQAANFERPSQPDGLYRVAVALVDIYNIRSPIQELLVRVRDVDEPDTWALPAPRVGATTAPTVTVGDRATVTSYEWARSADIEPRQWEPISNLTGGHYVPEVSDEGLWLRATVHYTDVGGAKLAMVEAEGKVLPNLPPTFNAAKHGTRMMPEHAHPGTIVGAPILALDTPGDSLTYTLVGNPAEFTIDPATGQLAAGAAARLDYETTPVVSVTVQVTDRGGMTATLPVSVTLKDVTEDGIITFAGEVQVAQEIVPRLVEDDGTYGVFGNNPEPVLLNPDSTPATILWQWQASMDQGATWHDVPAGGQRNYVPLPAHAGHQLRVLAIYDSPETPSFREMAVGVLPTPVAPVPVVESIVVVSTPDPATGYTYGDLIQVAVTFSEAVEITGTVGVELTFDGQIRRSATLTDDGTTPPRITWTLAYELVPGDPPASQIGVPAGTLVLTADGLVRNVAGDDAILNHPAAVPVAQPVRTLMPGIPDVNQDGRLEAVDGLILYYAAAWRAALGADSDGFTGDGTTRRMTFLGPLLAADVERTDTELRRLLRAADIMLAHGEPFNLDLIPNGVADTADALALYYALNFSELLGDGGRASLGFSHFREMLLTALWPTDAMPQDADFQQLLNRVRQLRVHR